jgi:ribosomal protein S18 acetylase RimI-like enzyme
MQHSSRISCENLTAERIRKYQEEGYELVFQEHVMEHDLHSIGKIEIPVSMAYKSWSKTLEREFYKIYSAAFKDRPGFPGWPLERWVEWISGDPDFCQELTLLASIDNHPIGFIANAIDLESKGKHGYIIQVGVIPEWRRKGVAAILVNKTLEAWREQGKKAAILHVNLNNPGAIRLYEGLGFRVVRTRGSFQKRPSAPIA